MKTAKFKVPTEVIADFSEEVESRHLEAKLGSKTQDDEVIVSIEYDREDAELIEELKTVLEDLRSYIEEEEEEEENEDDDDR